MRTISILPSLFIDHVPFNPSENDTVLLGKNSAPPIFGFEGTGLFFPSAVSTRINSHFPTI